MLRWEEKLRTILSFNWINSSPVLILNSYLSPSPSLLTPVEPVLPAGPSDLVSSFGINLYFDTCHFITLILDQFSKNKSFKTWNVTYVFVTTFISKFRLNFALLKLVEIDFQGKTDRTGTRCCRGCSLSVTLVVKIDNKDQYLDSERTIYRIHYILYQPITNNVKSFYQESHLKYTSVVVCL